MILRKKARYGTIFSLLIKLNYSASAAGASGAASSVAGASAGASQVPSAHPQSPSSSKNMIKKR